MFSNNLLMAAAGGGVELVEVGNSAMFDSANSEYLSWTPSSAASSVRIGTLSMWVYKAVQGADQQILQQDWTASGANAMSLHFGTSDGLYFSMENNAQNQIIYRANSSMKFRDIGWYHIHIAYNTNLSVEATACVMTVNGVVLDSWDSTTYSNGGVDSGWPNTGKPIGIGVFIGSDQFLGYLDMYLSEFYFQDGVFGAATDAGEFSDDGLYWTPKDDIQDLSFGTNGFYLDFSDSTHLGEIVGATTRTEILTGTTEANYNDSGGHAATKDKNRGHTRSGGLTNSSTNNDILTPGRDFGEATSITGIRAFAPSDNGFEEGGGSGTATLYGSDTANNDADKSERGSVAYTGANSEVIVIDDATGTYDHWWVEFEAGGHGKSTNVAELEFYTGAGTISAEYFVEINTVTQSTHTPTNSALLFNPLDGRQRVGTPTPSTDLTLSNGNRTMVNDASSTEESYGTNLVIPPAGKWHVEFSLDAMGGSNNYGCLHLVPVSVLGPNVGLLTDTGVWGIRVYIDTNNTETQLDGVSETDTGAVTAVGSNMSFDIDFSDMSSVTIISKDDGATIATDSAMSMLEEPYILYMGNRSGSSRTLTMTLIPEEADFVQTPAADHVAINTTNIAEATTRTVSDPYEHWANCLYDGTGAALDITIANETPNGSTFDPEFVWTKNRDQNDEHKIVDIVRGATKELNSDSNNAESTDANGVTSITSTDKYVLGTGAGGYNDSGEAFVGWAAKLGGAAVANTDGSITSSVSANTTLGMSVGTYTGSGSTATVGHGLSTTPGMIIVKKTSGAGDSWTVYHSGNTSAPETDYLSLDVTAATSDYPIWNDTAPTSSVFSVYSAEPRVNETSATYMFIAFAPSEFISIGSYEGNANADGPYVPCINSAGIPLQPIWSLVKNIDTVKNWVLIDAGREPYNVMDNHLEPDTSDAEPGEGAGDWYRADMVSGGIKLRGTGQPSNYTTLIHLTIGIPVIDKAGRILTAR